MLYLSCSMTVQYDCEVSCYDKMATFSVLNLSSLSGNPIAFPLRGWPITAFNIVARTPPTPKNQKEHCNTFEKLKERPDRSLSRRSEQPEPRLILFKDQVATVRVASASMIRSTRFFPSTGSCESSSISNLRTTSAAAHEAKLIN